MKQIWKYTIKPGTNSIEMPYAAEILTAQFQGDELQLWACVDPSREKETRRFEAYGTGHNIPGLNGFDRRYIATSQLGEFVFHVFELV